MDFNSATEYEIVPTYGGNLEDAKPSRIRCRYLTAPEREDVMPQEIITEADGETRIRIVVNRPRMVRLSVIGCDDFRFNGVEIKDGKALNEAQLPQGLYDEIVTTMIGRNRRRDLKN